MAESNVFNFYKSFSKDDCQEFARLSGDHNLLHVDFEYARRTIAGGVAVHGLHLALYALDRVIERTGIPTRLSVKFISFVNIGQEIHFKLSRETTDPLSWKIRGVARGTLAIVVSIQCSDALRLNRPSLPDNYVPVHVHEFQTPVLMASHDINRYRSLVFQYKLDSCDLRQNHLNQLANVLGCVKYASLLTMTHFVGMICPGEDSIFSQFEISFSCQQDRSSTQYFWVRKLDDRMGKYQIDVSGVANGSIIAFRRPRVITQDHISSYKKKLSNSDFRKVKALVIGGSRGLGAAAAKILAAGGAQVNLTYALGGRDAHEVSKEISSYAGIDTKFYKFNLDTDELNSISDLINDANFILYFATPQINKCIKSFDKKLFEKYFFYYVESITKLSSLIESSSSTKKIIFLPSTKFIDKRESGFVEYSLAKLAMEFVADSLSAKGTPAQFVYERLPELKTDQTSTFFSRNFEDTFSVLYPILKNITEKLA